jgi:peptidoglycan hydrolase-like protein with peptidoglycan-binding domain
MKKINIIAVMAMMMVLPFMASAATLTRELELGMSGNDVSSLQTFLAVDPTIYPQGLVTGYFGSLTKSAVSNFQSRNGIATVGRVGPATLTAINSQMNGTPTTSGGDGAPLILNNSVSAGANAATVSWSTNELAKGVVYYSNVPLSTYENANSVNVSGSSVMTNNNMVTNQNVAISGLQANTAYYYMIYTTDQSGYVSVTWPATFRTTN